MVQVSQHVITEAWQTIQTNRNKLQQGFVFWEKNLLKYAFKIILNLHSKTFIASGTPFCSIHKGYI